MNLIEFLTGGLAKRLGSRVVPEDLPQQGPMPDGSTMPVQFKPKSKTWNLLSGGRGSERANELNLEQTLSAEDARRQESRSVADFTRQLERDRAQSGLRREELTHHFDQLPNRDQENWTFNNGFLINRNTGLMYGPFQSAAEATQAQMLGFPGISPQVFDPSMGGFIVPDAGVQNAPMEAAQQQAAQQQGIQKPQLRPPVESFGGQMQSYGMSTPPGPATILGGAPSGMPTTLGPEMRAFGRMSGISPLMDTLGKALNIGPGFGLPEVSQQVSPQDREDQKLREMLERFNRGVRTY